MNYSKEIRRTVKTQGAQGLFRGLGATVFRESVGWAAFFSTYDILKKVAPEFSDNWTKTVWNLNAGGCSGIACWLLTLPSDNIKTL